MAFIIKVKPIAGTKLLALTHVTGGGFPQLDHDPYPVLIVWVLDPGSGGEFNLIPPINGNPPGFSWDPRTGTPSSDIFDTPTLRSNNRMISLTDFHPANSPAGEWNYLLCAMIGGEPYTTAPAPAPADGSARTPHDPVIINK